MAEPRATATPFLRHAAATGWPKAQAEGLTNDPGPLRLGITGRRPIAMNEPFGSFGGLRLPRGMAIGKDGRIFLADPEGGVILSALAAECVAGADPFRPLWPRRLAPDLWHLAAPRDVALTAAGDLVIADPEGGRVLVLAWPTAVIRQDLRLPGWRPTALTVAGDWLVVADPGLGRLHRFDVNGGRDPDWPHPSVQLNAPEFLALSASGDTLFVLDRGALSAIGPEGRRITATPETLLPPALQRQGNRLLWQDPSLPGHDRLVIPALTLTRNGHYGKIPVIALPRRISVPRSGHVIFDGFDSGQRGFAWDRITLDVSLPESGSLVLTTLTTDALIETGRINAQPDSAWSRPLTLGPGDAPEILVQSPPGRYLWLRIDFLSDGSASPEIARIDLFGPRRSGLRHLPASFHQDPQSRDFLDRFLSYFDTIFAEIGRSHRDSGALFDPAAVPEGAWLDWLGSWFDLEFLAEWDVATRREMVAAAIDSARMGGTARGLQRMLRWHLDLPEPWPMLVEHFRLGPGAPPLARDLLPQAPEPHRLTIVLPRARVAADAETRLARLVDGWLPAHVSARLCYVDTGMILGCQSLLGIDTLLSGSCPAPTGTGRAGIDFATAHPPARAPLHPPRVLPTQDRSPACLTT